MGVLLEALSVIVPVSALEHAYAGGVPAYEAAAPNKTFCTDSYLTRIGFMAPPDVKAFIDALRERGLRFLNESHFEDIAVVDQFQGPTAPCPWLECGRHEIGFAVAWLRGTSPSPMAAPAGWTIEQSRQLHFVSNEDAGARVLPLMREGMVDSVLDYKSGKIVYVGRTTKGTDLIL